MCDWYRSALHRCSPKSPLRCLSSLGSKLDFYWFIANSGQYLLQRVCFALQKTSCKRLGIDWPLQVFLLACPGVLLGTALVAAVARPYSWAIVREIITRFLWEWVWSVSTSLVSTGRVFSRMLIIDTSSKYTVCCLALLLDLFGFTMTFLVGRFVLPYNWSWPVSLTFGAVLT